MKLQLYSQEVDSMNHCLAEGSVVSIKEPYLKVTSDAGFGLRIDHVSATKSWNFDLSADDWKLKGNEWFNKGNYHYANDWALEASPSADEAITIRLNRALTHLRAHKFEVALRDLDVQPAEPKLLEKALYRKAQALYHLGRFRGCSEQQKGKYNFKRMQVEAAKNFAPELDHATYVGPVVVKMTKSHGRGFFTTAAVKAGDLLLCEKAFAYAFYDANNRKHTLSMVINTETNVVSTHTQAQLVVSIVQKLFKNPKMGEAFTNLHHGGYQPVRVSEADGLPVVDTFLLERIVSLNCFGCPLPSRGYHIETRGVEEAAPSFDERFHSNGIWTAASYLSHSCDSNSRRSFLGDVMVVRATCDMPADTEVTFSYLSPEVDASNGANAMMKPIDMKHWGFKCTCIICTDLVQTDKKQLRKRQRISESLTKTFNSLSPANIESVITALGETFRRPLSEVPDITRWNPAHFLAALYSSRGDPRKCIEFSLKGLASRGYVIEGGEIPGINGKTSKHAKLVIN
ncbi:hypothetical protein BDW74DRAFT_183819 [Aspergillus multicolor]|uniref:uncharacterized protein n=1 Tax=Aspergillus multicolor TaxID=41759 RepID=UPI003CCCC5D9